MSFGANRHSSESPDRRLAMVAAVPTRLRRAAALALAPALALALTACGGSDTTAKGFDAVSVSGDFGQAPTFDWKKQLDPGTAVTKTLVDGTGPALKDGDHALLNLAVGDSDTQQTPLTTFGPTQGGIGMEVGATPGQPAALGDLFTSFLSSYVKAGVKVGTRIAVAVGVQKAFPQYATAFASQHINIGNEDGIVIVVDVAGTAATAPKGHTEKAPGWAPKVTEKKGVPASLNFSGTPAPTGKLRVATLIKGTGPAVTAGQTAALQYLGQVYKAGKPFDESFSAGRFLYAQTGTKASPTTTLSNVVVTGLGKGLVGVPVGSRVIVQIPPSLGYGKSGNSQAGIKGTDTMYFLVDVLGAA